LPLYVLTARKLLYTIASSVEDRVQAEENLQKLLRMPIHTLMAALYPRVYPLPAALHEGADLPRPIPAMEHQIAKGASPAYLITNGLGMWYYQVSRGDDSGDSGASPSTEELRNNAVQLAEKIRREFHPSPAWIPLTELSRLPSAMVSPQMPDSTPTAPSGRPRFGSRTPGPKTPGGLNADGCGGTGGTGAPLPEISWQEKVLLSSLLVEDDGVTEMSYAAWVQFIQEQVASVICS